MAGKLSMAFLAAVVVAAFIQSSAAQATTHVVGGAVGWTIPPGGATVYANWAASQSFAVGDVLAFNFQNGTHDVATVTKADYDACTTTSPIQLVTTGPANIPINATGEHYYICNFPGHCGAGQKLMINVSAATAAPAPQPSSPSPAPQSPPPTPVSAPSPSPVSTAPTPSSPATPPTSPATPPTSPANPPTTPTNPPTTPTATPPGPSTTPPSPTTPSTPPPTGTTAPPPSDNSAKSLGVAGLSATFLSIAVAFLY